MNRVSRLVIASLSLATLVVSGCGAYPMAGATALGVRGDGIGRPGFKGFKGGMHGPAGAFGKGGFGEGGFGKGGFGKGGLAKGGFGLPGLPLLGIELTAEQQASLKAIVAKYQPAAPAKPDQAAMEAMRTAAKARHEALKAALTAETFDAAALKAALTPPADHPAKPQLNPQLLVEARALLTDEQRATAIAKLKAAPADRLARADKPAPEHQRSDFSATIAEKLALTDDQKAKLATIAAARTAAKPDADPAAHRDGLIKFLETGDTASLALEHTPPAPPIDAIVDFVGSLDAAQRAKLGDAGFLLGQGGFAGHGGGHRGGFGPRGGFGHKGGFAGHGPMGVFGGHR